MITGYMKQGSVEDAKDVFRKTVEKDVVVFNAMIEGYNKSINIAKRAPEVYIDMQRLDFSLMLSNFASITGACSILLAFEIGQQIQGQLMKTEFFGDVKMGSALIDMYSKCRRIEEARRVFDHMTERNVFSWTSMIDGYGKNGNPIAALELFRRMQGYCHIKPNYVTFLSSGLDIIMKMPKKPNSDVWAALISSCRLHGNLEIASITVNELLKLSSDSRPGAYVALSNALGEAGKWENVGEIREVMKLMTFESDGPTVEDIYCIFTLLRNSNAKQEKQKHKKRKKKKKKKKVAMSCCCGEDCECRPLGFLLGLPFAFVALLLSLVGVVIWIVGLALTCICPCCLCVTVIVELALALIKAPFSVMKWFTEKIPC
ncbi:unnamed protein product [Ilex paraguariensis]|uniref:Pentatricopeptide repeat-containing protein n=1 Tax=Ilex paraguariensis TaxID=185542 RepID=A0ABC8RT55_9AQUA